MRRAGRAIMVCLAALALSAATSLAQPAVPFPPAPDLSDTTIGAAPIFPASARVPFEEFCATFIAAAAPDGAPASVDACSIETGSYFVSAREARGIVDTARIKLNSTVATREEDLVALGAYARTVFGSVGWPVPPSVLAAVRDGLPHRCRTGPLRFNFSRERGDIPRYNLIVGIDLSTPDAGAFAPWVMPC